MQASRGDALRIGLSRSCGLAGGIGEEAHAAPQITSSEGIPRRLELFAESAGDPEALGWRGEQSGRRRFIDRE